jgi:hypothetical protein
MSERQRDFRLWREPLIHFFVLGLVVFGMRAVIERGEAPPDDPLLVEITSADIDWYRTMWRKRMGREPTVEELRGQVNERIREEILSREAVALGIDEGDMVVRRRLAQRMDFLFKDVSGAAEPSEDQLKTYLRDNRQTYEIPGRVSFTHVYFNSDERGEDEAAQAAASLAERLNAEGKPPQDTRALGDLFLLPSSYSDRTLQDVRGEFGQQFAEAIWEQEPGAWHGPVPSGYGVHAVIVHEFADAAMPEFDDLRKRVRADWMAERQRELAAEAYDTLRERYRVLLEGMPYDMDRPE